LTLIPTIKQNSRGVFASDREVVIPIIVIGGAIGIIADAFAIYQVRCLFIHAVNLPENLLPSAKHLAANANLAKETISNVGEVAKIATLLTAGNVYYEILGGRISEWRGTRFYFIALIAASVLGLTVVIVSTTMQLHIEHFRQMPQDPCWRRRQLCFALHCKSYEGTIFNAFNLSCFFWLSSLFVASSVKYYESGTSWLSLSWGVVTFLAASNFWMQTKRYKNVYDGNHLYGHTRRTPAIPGLFRTHDAMIVELTGQELAISLDESVTEQELDTFLPEENVTEQELDTFLPEQTPSHQEACPSPRISHMGADQIREAWRMQGGGRNAIIKR